MNRPMCLLLCLLPLITSQAFATEPEYSLVLEGHRYSPGELVVPAGVRVRLVLENKDQTPEEFESYALNREKLVAPGGTVVVYIGPLAPGRYEYFGDFNPVTARGWLVARP
jgi:heme/copper-type cytochrome/quinol oxidase subunit 2